MADLPVRDERGHRPDRLLDRDGGVGEVQVPEVDRVHPEPFETGFGGGTRPLGPSVGPDLVRIRDLDPVRVDVRWHDSPLRRDDHIVSAARYRLPDQPFVRAVDPVRVGRVDERDPAVEGVTERGETRRPVDVAVQAGEDHRPEADRADVQCPGE